MLLIRFRRVRGLSGCLCALALALCAVGCDDAADDATLPPALELTAPPPMRALSDDPFAAAKADAARASISRVELGYADGRLEGTVVLTNRGQRALLVPRTMFPVVTALADGAVTIAVVFPLAHTALPSDAAALNERIAEVVLPGRSAPVAVTVPLASRPRWVRVHVDYAVARDANATVPMSVGPIAALAADWPAPPAVIAEQLRAAGATQRASCDAVVDETIAESSALWPAASTLRLSVRGGFAFARASGDFRGVLDVRNGSSMTVYALVTASTPDDSPPLAPVTHASFAGTALTLRVGIPDVPSGPLDRRPLRILPITPGESLALRVEHNLGTVARTATFALAWTVFGPTTFPNPGDALIQGCPTMETYRETYRRLAISAPVSLID